MYGEICSRIVINFNSKQLNGLVVVKFVVPTTPEFYHRNCDVFAQVFSHASGPLIVRFIAEKKTYITKKTVNKLWETMLL